jgi:hypothetical protein
MAVVMAVAAVEDWLAPDLIPMAVLVRQAL